MGKVRARTNEELEARRQMILQAAATQIMEQGMEATTLATISRDTSISRTSMYTYYPTMQAVIIDLLILEYDKLTRAMCDTLMQPMEKEEFCRTFAHVLWEHPVLLKLLAQRFLVWDESYDGELLVRYVVKTQPFMQALDDVLAVQFPDSTDEQRNSFKVQLSVYYQAIYNAENVPDVQVKAMEEQGFFLEVPSGEDITAQGLLLFCSLLEDDTMVS